MTIESTPEYKAALEARRIFANLRDQVTELNKQTENLLTTCNAMRAMVGQVTLSLAQIEALYVTQTHDKRVVDHELFQAQTQIGDLLAKVASHTAQSQKAADENLATANKLQGQANRVAAERFVHDDTPGLPIPGVEYVDVAWFARELSNTSTHVRRLIDKGELPVHDAISSEDSDRPKFLWAKWKAESAVKQVLAKRKL